MTDNDDALVERVAQEMWEAVGADPHDFWDGDFHAYDCMARAAIEAARPVIRAAALEEAAKVCLDMNAGWCSDDHMACAAAIRALVEP